MNVDSLIRCARDNVAVAARGGSNGGVSGQSGGSGGKSGGRSGGRSGANGGASGGAAVTQGVAGLSAADAGRLMEHVCCFACLLA